MNRKLFYIANFLVLGLFILACLQDADREWKGYRKAFRTLEVERLTKKHGADSKQVQEAKARPIVLQQMMANDLNRAKVIYDADKRVFKEFMNNRAVSLGLPVVMIRRPPATPGESVASVEEAMAWLRPRLSRP